MSASNIALLKQLFKFGWACYNWSIDYFLIVWRKEIKTRIFQKWWQKQLLMLKKTVNNFFSFLKGKKTHVIEVGKTFRWGRWGKTTRTMKYTISSYSFSYGLVEFKCLNCCLVQVFFKRIFSEFVYHPLFYDNYLPSLPHDLAYCRFTHRRNISNFQLFSRSQRDRIVIWSRKRGRIK